VTVSESKTGEVPMGDGSSDDFVHLLHDSGVVEQEAPVEPLIIRKPVHVSFGDATLAALPGPTDKLEIIYDFEAAAPVGRQIFSFHLGEDDFLKELAPARTFVFEREVAELRRRGFGEHLTTKDLLVLGDNGPVENEFRFPDECVRHKVLDLIGDLTLAGRPIYGRLVAHKSGHELNHLMARKLLEHADNTWRQNLLGRENSALDIRKIQQILPHRFPMLLVDRVLEIVGDTRAVGIKNVTNNDIFFQGHYPGMPIMPGVLIVEALAQLGGILLSQKLEHTGKLAVLLSMDKVKMRTRSSPATSCCSRRSPSGSRAAPATYGAGRSWETKSRPRRTSNSCSSTRSRPSGTVQKPVPKDRRRRRPTHSSRRTRRRKRVNEPDLAPRLRPPQSPHRPRCGDRAVLGDRRARRHRRRLPAFTTTSPSSATPASAAAT
jgi:beta-hydroxyacyl-ACP dehydratase FabZ